jgi:hypothetical protein
LGDSAAFRYPFRSCLLLGLLLYLSFLFIDLPLRRFLLLLFLVFLLPLVLPLPFFSLLFLLQLGRSCKAKLKLLNLSKVLDIVQLWLALVCVTIELNRVTTVFLLLLSDYIH